MKENMNKIIEILLRIIFVSSALSVAILGVVAFIYEIIGSRAFERFNILFNFYVFYLVFIVCFFLAIISRILLNKFTR
jgi:hypothetical protein